MIHDTDTYIYIYIYIYILYITHKTSGAQYIRGEIDDIILQIFEEL